MTEAVDALSLRIFDNLFSSIADEMGVALQRASHSPNIKMRRDFSCAVFDSEGNLLAQAAHIPVHLGAMPMAMHAVRRRHRLGPGDVAILNDPYAGGTHLPDISLVSAAFADEGGTCLGYVMSRAHHSDVGGMSPGSMPLSTDIFQEGMIIPPLLLQEGGRQNEALLDLLLRNVRTPDERRGDLAAQLAALAVGTERMARLASEYGGAGLAVHGRALQAYGESLMRSLIDTIPPGAYTFRDYLDDDGRGSGPVPIAVSVRRSPGSTDLDVDFSESSTQCAGSINAVEAVTVSATLYVMRCLIGEESPVNSGSLAPLHISTPPGSVVAARPLAPVAAGNVETSQRIVDVLFGALAGALPDRVPAASQGTMNNLALGGYDEERGRPFAYYETMGGGMGARPERNGMSGVHDHMSNTLNTPVEVLETEYPLRVRRYGLRRGTGGRGDQRGGEGLEREIEFLRPAFTTLLSQRRVFAPYGLSGGGSGAMGENILIRAGRPLALDGMVSLEVGEGDVLAIRSPGGGGWGDTSVS